MFQQKEITMNKKLKRCAKKTLTFIYHPIMSIHLLKQGCHYFHIGKNLKINKHKYFHAADNFDVGDNFRVLNIDEYHGNKYKPSLDIGKNVVMGNRVSFFVADNIEVGEDCLIASDVSITSENHGLQIVGYDSYGVTPLVAKPVKIGKKCWIGEKCVILPGVILGDRCVVGAGSIVTKSFPEYSMIAGVPAKLIKKYNFKTHEWERVKD